MRKLIVAASAGVAGALLALSPALALTSYQINADGKTNFQDPDSNSSIGGLKITSGTEDGFGNSTTTNNFDSTSQQQNLSGDMSWQGTGYYLRPNR